MQRVAIFTILFGAEDSIRMHNVRCLADRLKTLGSELPFYVLTNRDSIPGIKTIQCDDVHGRRLLVGEAESKSVHNKLSLWNQVQFDKILYFDSDIQMNLRPDELLAVEFTQPLAAVPACNGYFNSGMMILKPNRTVFGILKKLSEHKFPMACARFHGDQNILNAFFKSQWKRLPQKWNHAVHFKGTYSNASDMNTHYVGIRKPKIC